MNLKPYAYPKESLWLRSSLWVLAVAIMLAAVVYQRTTGPTHPRKGEFESAARTYDYKLIRSDWSEKTNEAARVVLPDPGFGAELHWKRFRTPDAFAAQRFQSETLDGKPVLVGLLPAQPSAGKLEYFITMDSPEGSIRIPDVTEDNIVIRFKDHVPATILIPHILLMFFSVLIGMRAGLAAILAPSGMRRWAWVALAGMTVGGMVLGPIVQKYAFGDYWTGWPFGGDWTDNKMLFMWLSWVFATSIIGFRPRRRDGISRTAVVLAALVMTSVYLIPHSMGGSELNYEAVDEGIDPAEAIRTGKR
jgi:hypothetical protein